MLDVNSRIRTYLPSRTKTTPSGWLSFNAPCCHNRGEGEDRRQRGGMLFTDQGFQYHCFNCGFKAGWTVGKTLSRNTKQLLAWFFMPTAEIDELSLLVLKQIDRSKTKTKTINLDLETKQLPPGSRPLLDWIRSDLDPDLESKIKNVVTYICVERAMNIDWYAWYWSPEPGYCDRVIIPFYQSAQLVGYTARRLGPGNPKYLSEQQSGYVFNLDSQTTDRTWVIVCEGPFDAIAVDGVAILTNDPNHTQIHRIQTLRRQVVICPDRDRAGSKLIDRALEQEWAVSFPKWESGVKDAADAVKHYGRLYTVHSILANALTTNLKIELARRQWEKSYA